MAVDPRLCAAVRQTPAKPDGATIVQPVTAEARAAVALFLTWVAEVVDVGTENAARAEAARKVICPPA